MAAHLMHRLLVGLGLQKAMIVEKYANQAQDLSRELDIYARECYGIESWKHLLPTEERHLWPPRSNAALLRSLGKLLFYPAFISNPNLLRKCLLASFETRRHTRPPLPPPAANPCISQKLECDSGEWDFYGLTQAVARIAGDGGKATTSPHIHQQDIQNITTAWDCWIARAKMLEFPSHVCLEREIEEYQSKLIKEGGPVEPYQRSKYAKESLRKLNPTYQNMTLRYYVYTVEFFEGW